MEKQNDRQIGNQYEIKACAFLKNKGLKILKRNFRIRQGEIDIVANHKGTLVFVEVKYRKDSLKGTPEAAVDLRKQRQICKVALFYLSFHGLSLDTPCRFDVIAICKDEIHWIQNAFPFVNV